MKFFSSLLVICSVSAPFIEATYYHDENDFTTYRVRRSGVKGTVHQSGQYVQQEESGFDSGASLGGVRSSVRQLPSRPKARTGQYQEGIQQWSNSNQVVGQADAEPASYGGVAGQPGKDFPAYAQVPRTRFTCSGVPYEPGMYADEETQCQAYHVCFQGRKESFLCGVGTVFNQAILACDYWHSVDCSRTKEYYSVNEELGKAGAEPSPGGGGNQGVISQSNKWRQQQRPQTSSRQQEQQYSNDGQYSQYDQRSSVQSGRQYGQQKRPKYQQQPQYGSQQQQYTRGKVYRPQTDVYEESQEGSSYDTRSQVQLQGPRKSYRPQVPFQQAPGQHSSRVVKAKVQYGNQQINTHVESVSEESHDQAAVRAGQLVAPGPRPQFGPSTYVGQQRPRSGPQQQYGKLGKYHTGVGNQLSPSYRSKALQSQVQSQQFSADDGQYEQPQAQYRAPQQQYRPQSNQRQVDSFKDTQQKLNY